MTHNLYIITMFKTYLWLLELLQNVYLSVSRKKTWFNTLLMLGGVSSFIYPQYFG